MAYPVIEQIIGKYCYITVVNGTNKAVQDTYAPAAVINALKRLGWVIPAGEQDAHELLNVILTTLDEESQKIGRKVNYLYNNFYLKFYYESNFRRGVYQML